MAGGKGTGYSVNGTLTGLSVEIRIGFTAFLTFRPHAAGMKTIRRFLADQSTVMFIEYGLIAVVMAFVMIGAVNEAQH
jgi:hypothetical protein